MGMAVRSEVGKLRKVMVHRPGLEHTRLTPENAGDLLFDDVLWVKKATAEHDAFCESMRERGVEVYEVESLLRDVIANPEGRSWIADHALNERMVGINGSQRAREWINQAPPAEVADFLIGGITAQDIRDGKQFFGAFDPTEILLPPLPNFMFQRDHRAGFDSVTRIRWQAGAQAGNHHLEASIAPYVRLNGVKVWFGGAGQDWGWSTVEEAASKSSAMARDPGAGDVRHPGRDADPRSLFETGSATQRPGRTPAEVASHAPRHSHDDGECTITAFRPSSTMLSMGRRPATTIKAGNRRKPA